MPSSQTEILAGLDPSFRGSGISVLSGNSLILTKRSIEIEDKKQTFQNVWYKAEVLSEEISDFLISYKVSTLISEIPPPNALYSAGLWCLDSMIFTKCFKKGIKNIFTIPPNYIASLHGKRKYLKSESTTMAKEILANFSDDNFEIICKKRINNDTAESFLLLCRLLSRKGLYTDKYQFNEGFQKEKEKQLVDLKGVIKK